MSESEENGERVFPTGSTKEKWKEVGSDVKRVVRGFDSKEYFLLREHSLSDENNPWIDIEISAAVDLKEQHKKAGVTLKHRMPTVFIVPSENWDTVQTAMHDQVESHVGIVLSDGEMVAVKEREDKIHTASTIYHEMFHAVGRSARTYTAENKVKDAEGGYLIEGPSTRGQSLEEGMAVYFSESFISKNYPYLHEAQVQLVNKWFPGKEMNAKNIQYAANAEITNTHNNNYILARAMVSLLIRAGGEEMENLLLAARIDKSKTRDLVDKINESFDSKEAAKRVFSTDFTDEALADTNMWLLDRFRKVRSAKASAD